jgi:hypothetical protein
VRRMVDSSLKVEPHPFLKCGEWVRITSGPLDGIEGVLVRKANSFRLVLSVEMLQKSVAVEVDVSMVEPVSKPAGQTPMTALGWATGQGYQVGSLHAYQ